MSVTVIILLCIFAVSLLALIVLFIKKLPQLRIIDPSTQKSAVSRQLKYEIIRKRVEKAGGKPIEAMHGKVVAPMGRGLQQMVRRIAGKLTAVERAYQEKQRAAGGKLSKEELDKLLDEGKEQLLAENYDRAEKTLIEVISNDPRNVRAYEFLGRLYMLKKDLKSARQTFIFLKKINPTDASVLVNLGEVEEQEGNMKEALQRYKEAVEISPKNPKYLDFLIHAAIDQRDMLAAQSALTTLKEVNPENSKIAVYDEEVKKYLPIRKKKTK